MYYVKSNPKIRLCLIAKLWFPKFTYSCNTKRLAHTFISLSNYALYDIHLHRATANDTLASTGSISKPKDQSNVKLWMTLTNEKCLLFRPLASAYNPSLKSLSDPQSFRTNCHTIKKIEVINFLTSLTRTASPLNLAKSDGILKIQSTSIHQLPRYFRTKSLCQAVSGPTSGESNTSNKYTEDEVPNVCKNINDKCRPNNIRLDIEEERIVKVRHLLSELTYDQRREILTDLQYEEALERRKAAEEKLASWHWRSKFGRPTSIKPSTVDASGTYCEIPHDWLMKKVAETAIVSPPTLSDLRDIAVFNALPFVGFGFLDNVIMIVAGDYIDITIGTYLGISTMAAAALGNTISDLAGIGSASYVEFLASKVGMRYPDLTKEQQNMSSTRWSANIGRGIGVVLGCFLGMFPLMFLSDRGKKQVEEKDEQNVKEGTSPKEKGESGR